MLSVSSLHKLEASSTTCEEAGTISFPFKLAIIGGGPAGCAIIIRAIRLGLVDKLCQSSISQPSDLPTMGGICMIDKGNLERFGGGRLQDYAINSNTWAGKFVTNVIADKGDNLPPESIEGTILEKLRESQYATELEMIGCKNGPLKSIGGFLRDAGHLVYETIEKFPLESKCLLETTITSIQRYDSKDFSGWQLTAISNSESEDSQRRNIYASHVVFASGGKQEPPKLSNSNHNSKIIMGDVACTLEGMKEIRKRMRTSGKYRVAIVGGSHSAFSAAWMCLNKLDDLSVDNNNIISSCANAENSEISVEKTIDINHTSLTETDMNDKISPTAPSPSPSYISKLGPNSICILHRSSIKVFYGTKKDAESDNYVDFGVVNKTTGQIHPFAGLRGDAKELWRAIKNGRETRVRLVKSTGSNSVATKLFEDAAVVIWACGYSSSVCPVFDASGKQIPLRYSRGQIEIDDYGRLLRDTNGNDKNTDSAITPSPPPSYSSSLPASVTRVKVSSSNSDVGTCDSNSEVIPGLLGTGLGFGLKAEHENGELDGSTGRADGVAVYLKRAATLVLAAVLGNQVYGGGNITSWEERTVALKKMSKVTDNGGDDQNNDNSDTNDKICTSQLSPARNKKGSVQVNSTSSLSSTTAGNRPSKVFIDASTLQATISRLSEPSVRHTVSSTSPVSTSVGSISPKKGKAATLAVPTKAPTTMITTSPSSSSSTIMTTITPPPPTATTTMMTVNLLSSFESDVKVLSTYQDDNSKEVNTRYDDLLSENSTTLPHFPILSSMTGSPLDDSNVLALDNCISPPYLTSMSDVRDDVLSNANVCEILSARKTAVNVSNDITCSNDIINRSVNKHIVNITNTSKLVGSIDQSGCTTQKNNVQIFPNLMSSSTSLLPPRSPVSSVSAISSLPIPSPTISFPSLINNNFENFGINNSNTSYQSNTVRNMVGNNSRVASTGSGRRLTLPQSATNVMSSCHNKCSSSVLQEFNSHQSERISQFSPPMLNETPKSKTSASCREGVFSKTSNSTSGRGHCNSTAARSSKRTVLNIADKVMTLSLNAVDSNNNLKLHNRYQYQNHYTPMNRIASGISSLNIIPTKTSSSNALKSPNTHIS